MQISIKCSSTELVPFQELHALQGGLKIREKRDIQQLKDSIIEHGFLFPLFIWTAPDQKKHIIAGHGRLQAVAELKAENHEIDKLPVDYIEAKTLEEAKHILLHEVSNYGQLSFDGILEFAEGLGTDFSEMSFDGGKLDMTANLQEASFLYNPENKEREINGDIETECECPSCGYQW